MTVLRTFVHSLLGLVLGTVWFTLLVTGWATGLGLLITLLGLPVVWLTLVGARWMATVEAALAARLLGARVAPPPRLDGWRLRERVTEQRIWRAQLYLLLRFALGIADAVVLISAWSVALGLLAAPAWYWSLPDGIELGLFDVDEWWIAVAVMPLGLVAGLVALALTAASRRMWCAIAERLLPAADAHGTRVAGAGTGGGLPPLPRIAPPLPWTAGVAAAIALLCVFLQVTAGGSWRWPAWAALGLAVPVGIQASYAARAFAPSPRVARLIPAGGTCLVAVLVCIGAWALAGGGYFWPAWVVLGTAIGFALKAVGELGAESERRVLAPRLEQLARTRAGVVDARDDELRRIERDLHDGAQARLVAMTMSLGLAEERLDRDPDAARELVAEAQQQARTAIKELRDLARGIAPPVLTDRGLRAAVEALSATSPLPVAVSGDVGPRPSASIERAGYFVVAEALANAGKHAGATAVHVTFARWPDRLVVTVADDGRGGARADGSGLGGLRGRVEGVDGRLEVFSPHGEGTTVRATLPCASS